MPIIREMSNIEKIILMYKGTPNILERTNYNSRPSQMKSAMSIDRYYQSKKQKNNRFQSNDQNFCVKFNSSFPKNPLSIKTLYLKRRSQMISFFSRKVSRKDLEQILKWSLFYNKENQRFTVPCAGSLYHYEIYLCLFRSYILPLGLYRYNPQTYTLGLIKKGNFMEDIVNLFSVYLDRLKSASGVIFLTSNLCESQQKYEYRSERLILLDIGHLMHSMNLSLTSAGYGVSNIGAGKDTNIIKFLTESKKSNYIASLFFGGKDEKL